MDTWKWYLCPRCALAFIHPHPVRDREGRVLFEVCPRCGAPVKNEEKSPKS